mgnify:CR=1 FL=1
MENGSSTDGDIDLVVMLGNDHALSYPTHGRRPPDSASSAPGAQGQSLGAEDDGIVGGLRPVDHRAVCQ